MMTLPFHYLMSLDLEPRVTVLLYDDTGFIGLQTTYILN